MQLLCSIYPVTDLDAAVDLYRSVGFQDVARPDQDTVLLAGGESSHVTVMLERHPVESQAGPGPVFRIANVESFRQDHPELDWVFGPVPLPTGGYGLFRDPEGNPIRVMDFGTDSGRYARLFNA
ncbi:hypothetical protein FB566_1169 [Stackebrandtia endophytica]|uniref:VOC domain-containing protein n=1 Tax=Stackebrandtia endophytica TaxID=1496996 RepID=A0A543ASW0_9ACTN|nr:VOC family protein [Stackebrandtia endophytica]TQL75658.1 hypothetical protein FB566_1169 [Stackebrandtia endophytica]